MRDRILFQLALLVAFSGIRGPLRADVIREEPNPYTINASDVVAVGTAEPVKGQGPFTHASPPTVAFQIQQAFKGCRTGERVEVSPWWNVGKPFGKYGQAPSLDQIQAWERTLVKVPPPGIPVLLFLRKSGQGPLQLTLNGWGHPIWFESPSEDLIAATNGLMTLELYLSGSGNVYGRVGAPTLRGKVKNISPRSQTLDPGHVVVSRFITPLKRFESRWKPDRGSLPEPIVLAPGETREFQWDLRKFAPAPVVFPGNYWISLEIPALCDKRGFLADFAFQITQEPSFVEAAAACPTVFTGTTGQIIPQPDGKRVDVVMRDRTYFTGEEVRADFPVQLPWPKQRTPLPRPGERFIVCYGGDNFHTVVYVAKASPELERQLKAMLRAGR